jgi:hypothetical protein
MLCDIAWARAHGTATFILPEVGNVSEDRRQAAIKMNMPGLPEHIVALTEPLPPGEVCGRCWSCPMGKDGPPAKFFCEERNFDTEAKMPGCHMYVAASI